MHIRILLAHRAGRDRPERACAGFIRIVDSRQQLRLNPLSPMSTLNCFVLMPFSGHRSFVYHLAIKEAVALLNKEFVAHDGPSIEVHVERADEVSGTSTDVLNRIRSSIKNSDIIITDISKETRT
jgi:hypothetical protein